MFNQEDYPNLLIGLGDPDDAAVWKLDDDKALVVTTDFFTPVVDDPFEYGAVAAANSLSDVYAMGGKPFLALNIAAFPPKLPPEFLSEILRGGAEIARKAGVVIAGGHTIQDVEPKYGLIAVGFVDPAKMMTKSGAKPGDVLVLSKPLGFGTTTTAIKNEKASQADIQLVTHWMKILNKEISELAVSLGVRGATDITGFSLLGHAWEMAENSGVGLRFEWDRIPFIECAEKYGSEYIFPGGASDNRLYYQKHVQLTRELKEWQQMLLFDPQTSGGLLLSVLGDQLETFLSEAKEQKSDVRVVGEVVEGTGIEVV